MKRDSSDTVEDDGEAIVSQEKKGKQPVAEETEDEYKDFEVVFAMNKCSNILLIDE